MTKATPGDASLRRALVEREVAIHRYRSALEHAAPLGAAGDPLRGVCLHRLGRYEEALAVLDPERADHVLLVHVDRTERRGTEERLRDSEQQLRAIVDSVVDGIITMPAPIASMDSTKEALVKKIQPDELSCVAWISFMAVLLSISS